MMIKWANGVPVTEDELIDVLMWWYGANASDIRKELPFITDEKKQEAVNYYLEKMESEV